MWCGRGSRGLGWLQAHDIGHRPFANRASAGERARREFTFPVAHGRDPARDRGAAAFRTTRAAMRRSVPVDLASWVNLHRCRDPWFATRVEG
jgi:hypothetical protein